MCYPPQPSASADNTNLSLNNSRYHAQPHPIIVNYHIVEVENPDNFESQGAFSQVKWSRPEVLFLLSLYKEREHRFKDKKSKKKTLCEEITREMREQVYDYTGPQCETKFKNLKQGYTKTVDHNNKSGNDKKTCPYFKELSLFMS